MHLAHQNHSPEARSTRASNIAIQSFKHVICSPRTPSRTILVVAELSPRNKTPICLVAMYCGQDYSPQGLSVLTEQPAVDRVPAPLSASTSKSCICSTWRFPTSLHHERGEKRKGCGKWVCRYRTRMVGCFIYVVIGGSL